MYYATNAEFVSMENLQFFFFFLKNILSKVKYLWSTKTTKVNLATQPNISTPKTDLTHKDELFLVNWWIGCTSYMRKKIHYISLTWVLPLMLYIHDIHPLPWDIYPSHAPREMDETRPSELLTSPNIVSFNKEYVKPKIIQEAGLHISCMVTSFVLSFSCWLVLRLFFLDFSFYF